MMDIFKIMVESKIDDINNSLQLLSEIGVQIHDNDDFEYVIDYVYYSPAQKRTIVKFKEKRSDDETI